MTSRMYTEQTWQECSKSKSIAEDITDLLLSLRDQLPGFLE